MNTSFAFRNRFAVVVLGLCMVVALIAGCGGSSAKFNPNGTWNLRNLNFQFSNTTWTLTNVSLVITDTRVTVSGYRGNTLWAWTGSYSLSGNTLRAVNMPEVDLGANDRLDLQLRFSGNSVTGHARNHGSGFDGTADINGTRASSSTSFITPSATVGGMKNKWTEQ